MRVYTEWNKGNGDLVHRTVFDSVLCWRCASFWHRWHVLAEGSYDLYWSIYVTFLYALH